ncbi:hypothetical protein [Clostridium sp. BJN0001]|uniref:hypothetical protein n=1 Tax=Clostridium sp. BJN0001 TaxID=2930219 RepID=UPI001FD553E9|nr:hypothetical protein [Clostridium sp. BJN0001]
MKLIAIILIISCLIDIINPSKRLFKSYIRAKKRGVNVKDINFKAFYKAEILNIIALIFFIIFIFKY